MTVLVPMTAETFAAFAEEAVLNYAADNVRAGRWDEAGSLERARRNFGQLASRGLATPGHHFLEIRTGEGEAVVGHVWFAVLDEDGARSGYLYYIRVLPEFRGRGHAKAALDLVDAFARSLGLSKVALHVFSFNAGAQALYRSAGYWTTGSQMVKTLA